jgi:hypothetical protein
MLREHSGVLLLLLRGWRREEGIWRKPQKGRAFAQHNEKKSPITFSFFSSRAFARVVKRPIRAVRRGGVSEQDIESTRGA